MQALILDAEHKTAHVKTIPQPNPRPDEVLVRVHAVALNPIDPLYVANPLGSTGRVVGSDFAGTITSIGQAVPTSSGLHLGDKVAGFLQGACSINERPGAFADFLVCPWDLVWRVPEHMDFEKATAVSLCGLTAAQAVYYRFGLDAPFKWKREEANLPLQDDKRSRLTINFFIFSASTSVAMYAAQLVRHSAETSGVTIKLFGTASESRFQMLRNQPYNYNHLVDYHDASWPDKILELSDGRGMDYILDCISEGDSVSKVSQTLREGGHLVIVRSKEGGAWKAENLPVEPVYGAVWEGLGVEIQYSGLTVPKSFEARAFAVEFYKWLSGGGKLEPNPVRVMPGGLGQIVEDGFVLLGSGSMQDRDCGRKEAWMRPVSAEKLVYPIRCQRLV